MTIEAVANSPDLQIKLFTAVGQILVAAAVGVIALRQWLTARNKLKADLFDRRFALVKELRRRVNTVRAGQVKAEDFLTLPDLAREAGFLFNKNVRRTSELLVENLTDYHRQQVLLNEAHATLVQERQSLLNLMNNSQEERIAAHEQMEKRIANTIALIGELGIATKDRRSRVSGLLNDLESMTSNFLTLKH
ncbi:hypothetical protein [Stenotrophomonas sp. S41]|uniref:hypothetical protein n=1 Tax=Stenotrophomonas sp. S41 TaxID=2767464 RepID=UPI00190E2BAF|nr:hypothetical protein [Stenotrophomonas sp. S41]MBK0010774.1 hypothetical protein [Stenotrophomonas sp. S41]